MSGPILGALSKIGDRRVLPKAETSFFFKLNLTETGLVRQGKTTHQVFAELLSEEPDIIITGTDFTH
jgi:hypothetical protein